LRRRKQNDLGLIPDRQDESHNHRQYGRNQHKANDETLALKKNHREIKHRNLFRAARRSVLLGYEWFELGFGANHRVRFSAASKIMTLPELVMPSDSRISHRKNIMNLMPSCQTAILAACLIHLR
jgi:hypothetical protein